MKFEKRDKHGIRNPYPCNLVINKWKLTSLEISQYYKTRPGREKITDELIIELVESLDGEDLVPDPKKRPSNWDYFTLKSIFDKENNPYRLVCCHEENSPIWGVVNIYLVKIKRNGKKNKSKSNYK